MAQNFPKNLVLMKILEGKFLKGSKPMAAHRLKSREFADNQEGQEAEVQFRGHHQILRALFRRILGWGQRDYLKWANHDGLHRVLKHDRHSLSGWSVTRK
jgi:hypothetical protein